jgi:protein-arginine kinase activator protein McsA
MALDTNDRTKALAEIDQGRREIGAFLREYNQQVDASECFELDVLNRWFEELSSQTSETPSDLGDQYGVSQIDLLRNHLQKAIDREDYEHAAMLRDQIKRLESSDQSESAAP